MRLTSLAQPQEKFSTIFLIIKISSFVVFLSWFMMESPSWLVTPKIPSGKSICHWILKWKKPLLKLFLVKIFQPGIVCCLIECFHGDVVSLIVLHCSQTMYSIFWTKYSTFYPLPHCKDKLICSFLDLIFNGKSIVIDNFKDSFH
jgi:hypothetical protein